MRPCGPIEAPTGLGYHDHVCWGYDDHQEFIDAVLVYLEDGVKLGQRVQYVANGSPTSLAADVAGLPGIDELIATGALQLHDLGAMYAETGAERADPRAEADAWAETAWHAVADGYTGLRVAADVTELVLDPDDRHSFVSYEHVADRLMAAGLPLTGMCSFDLRRLGPAFDELACVHPLTHGATCSYCFHAVQHSGLALSGEVDTLSARSFVQTLDRLFPVCQQPITIDCSGLHFIDHRSLLAMDEAASRAGVSVGLLGASPLVLWLSTVLPLRSLEIAVP